MGIAAFFTSIPQQTLEQLLENPDKVEELLYPDDDSEPPHSMDLDKAWHGLHYLLTGDAAGGAPPLSLAILGGTEIGPEFDFGPPRYLTADEVKAVAQALAALTPAILAQRFNPRDMQEKDIYPAIWDREGDEELEYLQMFFPTLRQFYADAAGRDDVVIHWLA